MVELVDLKGYTVKDISRTFLWEEAQQSWSWELWSGGAWGRWRSKDSNPAEESEPVQARGDLCLVNALGRWRQCDKGWLGPRLETPWRHILSCFSIGSWTGVCAGWLSHRSTQGVWGSKELAMMLGWGPELVAGPLPWRGDGGGVSKSCSCERFLPNLCKASLYAKTKVGKN